MASPFSTNELFLRSDRIAFGKVPPEVPVREERLLLVPDFQGYRLFIGLSSLVSTSLTTGTLEDIYPQNASFTFDTANNRLGIGVSSPQYGIDINTNTGVRISGGMLIANAFGLQSVPTASLISTLPSYLFAPGTIPPTAIASTGTIQGISVPTAALFSTLPTSLFAPNTIPLSTLQSTGVLYASSFIANSFYGDGYNISNIPLSNIVAGDIGNFFAPNTIPLNALASTGTLWIRSGSLFVPTLSTNSFFTSSIEANSISTKQIIAGRLVASTFTVNTLSFSNVSAITIQTSSINVNGGVSANFFAGDGAGLVNIDPQALNTVIPSDKFGYRLIAWDAINPYGNFLWLGGNATFGNAVPVQINSTLTVLSRATFGPVIANTVTANLFTGDGSGLYNLNAISSLSLQSTVIGLGSVGFVSSLSLQSTVIGLGSADYASTSFVYAAISSFSTSYSSGGLISTVAGLGTAGYASTSFVGAAFSSFSTALGPGGGLSIDTVRSTVTGLGSVGYLSSFNSISTISAGLILASSIGIGCNAPAYTLDIDGSAHANFFSSFTILTSSYTGNLADAQTLILWEV